MSSFTIWCLIFSVPITMGVLAWLGVNEIENRCDDK